MVLWNLAAVVGVPGVGKTTLCQLAAESTGYHYVNYGELMLQVAKEERTASTQEEMFKLPLNTQHEIWKEAALRIHLQEEILVDLHGIDRSPIGYLFSLPLEIIKPEIIIVVESSCENIIKRRISDKDKPRPNENMASIKEHMSLLRISMAVCSAYSGSYLAILENNDFQKSLSDLEAFLGG